MNNKICVIGMGYIGFPTAVVLANSGYDVLGVDIDENIINKINKGEIFIKEPFLQSLSKDLMSNNKLKFRLSPIESDVFIISVQTPINEEKQINLKYILNALDSILPYIRKDNIIILESTVSVGTVDKLAKLILEKSGFKVGIDLYMAYCPERVLPGNIIKEIYENNRIIGGIDEKSALKAKKIYESFVKGKIYITDTKTAEMVKLVENTYRDVNIAFSNEVLKICENLNINPYEVIKYCNKHPRVNILDPGPGVGGHCIPVDPWFIVEKNKELSQMIKLARVINDSMPSYIFSKIEKITKSIKEDKKISIFGISYKANVGDIRESPILKLIDILLKHNYKVSIYDPYVKNYEMIECDLNICTKNSDLILIGTDHDVFKYLDYKNILNNMKNNLIFDTRNMLDKKTIEYIGFRYVLLGLDYKIV